MRHTIARFFLATSLIAALTGCTRGCSRGDDIPPEEQLHTYISQAVNVTKNADRQELINRTSGNLKSALVNMSDEAFKRAYIEKKYDFRTFEIIERKDLGEKEVTIDFRLQYKAWNSGERPERSPLIDTRNRAYLVYELGHWAIAKVESLQSDFEWEEGLPMDDVKGEELKPGEEPKTIESSREEPPAGEAPAENEGQGETP